MFYYQIYCIYRNLHPFKQSLACVAGVLRVRRREAQTTSRFALKVPFSFPLERRPCRLTSHCLVLQPVAPAIEVSKKADVKIKFFSYSVVYILVLLFYFSNHVKLFVLSSSSEDHRYIELKTKVHTFHFQDSLPRLPIPKLEDTCRRYLDAQKPLLTPEQYENTKRLVDKFQKREALGMYYTKSNLIHDISIELATLNFV